MWAQVWRGNCHRARWRARHDRPGRSSVSRTTLSCAVQNSTDNHDIAFYTIEDEVFAVHELAGPPFVGATYAWLFAEEGEDAIQLLPVGFGLAFAPVV